MSGRTEITKEMVDELLHRTCTERGLPIVIEDPVVIAKIAQIVMAPRGNNDRR